MIPSIEDIVAGLLSGQYTKEQAIGWLYAHCDIAESELEKRTMRNQFAQAALIGELACQDVRNDGKGTGIVSSYVMGDFAERIWEIADAVMQKRSDKD